MARPRKLLDNIEGNLTKEQIIQRKDQEKHLMTFNKDKLVAPPYLCDIARNEFNRIIPLVKDMPVCNLDLGLLVMYCSFYADFVKASEECNRKGITMLDSNGKTKVSPQFRVKEVASREMEKCAKLLHINLHNRTI